MVSRLDDGSGFDSRSKRRICAEEAARQPQKTAEGAVRWREILSSLASLKHVLRSLEQRESVSEVGFGQDEEAKA